MEESEGGGREREAGRDEWKRVREEGERGNEEREGGREDGERGREEGETEEEKKREAIRKSYEKKYHYRWLNLKTIHDRYFALLIDRPTLSYWDLELTTSIHFRIFVPEVQTSLAQST